MSVAGWVGGVGDAMRGLRNIGEEKLLDPVDRTVDTFDRAMMRGDGQEAADASPAAAAEQTLRCRVKWFDAVKGYGFLVSELTGADILIHYNLLAAVERKSLPEGASVTALVRQAPRGLQAVALSDLDLSTASMTDSPVPAARRRDAGDRPDRSALADAAGPFEPVTVRWFNRTKGYGFILCADGITQAFVHVETVRRGGFEILEAEQPLAARVAHGPKGALVVEVAPPAG